MAERLDPFYLEAKENGFIELPTIEENVFRNLALANVILPLTMFCFIQFHVEVAIPINTSAHHGKSSSMSSVEPFHREGFRGPLLITSMNCKMFSTLQVRTTFKRFISGYDPNLTSISTMTVHPIYANYMIIGWKAGIPQKRMSQYEFLQYKVVMMNKSVEQLTGTLFHIMEDNCIIKSLSA